MARDSVSGLAISGGTISQVDRTGREIPLVVPNEYRPGEGRLEGRVAGRWLRESRRVRALVLEGSRLRLVIASSEELPFAPPRTPMLYVFSASRTGVPSAVEPGTSLRVIGTDFVSASRREELVRILMDGQAVAQGVQVDADGSFALEIPVRQAPGEMVVTAEQRDGRRLTVAKATIDVVTPDRPEGAKGAWE